MLELLKAYGFETHLVMSDWAERTIRIEIDYSITDVCGLASTYYIAVGGSITECERALDAAQAALQVRTTAAEPVRTAPA